MHYALKGYELTSFVNPSHYIIIKCATLLSTQTIMLKLTDTKFYRVREVTTVIEELVPYKEAREIIIWTTAQNERVAIQHLHSNHIVGILRRISSFPDQQQYNELTVGEWTNVLSRELLYREYLQKVVRLEEELAVVSRKLDEILK